MDSPPDVRRQALFIGVFGAPGSGKSHAIKALIADAPPGIIFDPGHEYPGNAFVNENAFYRAINERRLGWQVLRPPFADDIRLRMFDRFCLAALAIARNRGQVLIVIDELHLVTTASNAPPGWRELVLTGRKFGAQVIAASIRPALIDKHFWTVCTHVRCGRLNYAEDQATMANALGVPIDDVRALSGFQFISRNMLTGEVKRG